jgi:hypothetical protein
MQMYLLNVALCQFFDKISELICLPLFHSHNDFHFFQTLDEILPNFNVPGLATNRPIVR